MVINKGSYVPAKLKSEYRITLSKKDKSLIEDALLNTVGGLRKGNNFNAEWRKCNNAILLILSRTGAYPIGCSQKLINLLMKYYYAYYYAEIDREWMAKNHWVNRVAIDMDIPIDSIVLKSLRQTKYSYHATRITGGQTPKLFCKKHPPQSWSQLNCMKCYQDLQKFCKQHAAASGYIDAMEFEMTELWP